MVWTWNPDFGPGAVCRRAGIPDGIDPEFAREQRARKQALELDRHNRDMERFAALKARSEADKVEIAAVRERAAEAQRAHISKFSRIRRRR